MSSLIILYFYLNSISNKGPHPLAIKPGYGYTHVAWEDMDLDSHPDAIAIRAKSTGSELVWLQQPPSNVPWPDHIIDEEVGGEFIVYFAFV